jgi:hypothetical protein
MQEMFSWRVSSACWDAQPLFADLIENSTFVCLEDSAMDAVTCRGISKALPTVKVHADLLVDHHIDPHSLLGLSLQQSVEPPIREERSRSTKLCEEAQTPHFADERRSGG